MLADVAAVIDRTVAGAVAHKTHPMLGLDAVIALSVKIRSCAIMSEENVSKTKLVTTAVSNGNMLRRL